MNQQEQSKCLLSFKVQQGHGSGPTEAEETGHQGFVASIASILGSTGEHRLNLPGRSQGSADAVGQGQAKQLCGFMLNHHSQQRMQVAEYHKFVLALSGCVDVKTPDRYRMLPKRS